MPKKDKPPAERLALHIDTAYGCPSQKFISVGFIDISIRRLEMLILKQH
jgi:hypothetical protein